MTENKKGKIIVIEGTDSSGKETQTKLLFEKLKEKIEKTKKISFPNYESEACGPVKMYLAGKFGKDAEKINPYPISTMYAIDRYASFKTEWENDYISGYIIVTDRYTTSNMVHQASKLDNQEEKNSFLEWLEDLEYKKIGIPKPDLVIFLNMPIEISKKLMNERKNKITGEEKKDIHERDENHLKKAYENACELSKRYSWAEISCVENKRLKTVEEISDEIYSLVSKML